MIRRTPFLRINLQFSQIRLTEDLTFIVSPLSLRGRTASWLLLRRLRCSPQPARPDADTWFLLDSYACHSQPSHQKEQQADRSQTDPSTDSTRKSEW